MGCGRATGLGLARLGQLYTRQGVPLLWSDSLAASLDHDDGNSLDTAWKVVGRRRRIVGKTCRAWAGYRRERSWFYARTSSSTSLASLEDRSSSCNVRTYQTRDGRAIVAVRSKRTGLRSGQSWLGDALPPRSLVSSSFASLPPLRGHTNLLFISIYTSTLH
ncbi:hypothetical protein AAT19DRAFT_14341 [Rhodotorula toruloides]|uniref:Uncharacterized protein n=1 Tax=Rhodotorula toruloides TaxID=5286 RepID=A0A2T0ABD5_RHOTO|nr:hypothetical protein AAT19DRAFT_14341 [Rhodotorula toruloides]